MAAEKNFENRIKKYLESRGHWFIKYWGGGIYTKSGVPDLICCINGYFVAVEVKAPNGKPSELQKVNLKKIHESGGFGILLYPKDFHQFKEMVECLEENMDVMAITIQHRINGKRLVLKSGEE